MPRRRFALLVALYLTLDLTNPFLGSAFNFNVEESLEGVSRQHERLLHATSAIPGPAALPAVTGDAARSRLAREPRARALAEWFVEPRPAHVHTSDPPPPTEDH